MFLLEVELELCFRVDESADMLTERRHWFENDHIFNR